MSIRKISTILFTLFFTFGVFAMTPAVHAQGTDKKSGSVCQGFGPQTPRDIDQKSGKNPSHFSMAPHYSKMNLCNINFHAQAEHRAKAFSIPAGPGKNGVGGGFKCKIGQSLSQKELAAPKQNFCQNVKPGDTIEMHWVYSSCDVKPGKGLGSCLSETCANPDLRVETQVFTVVNDSSAMNFMDFAYGGHQAGGYHQAKAIPSGTGKPVQFTGSTTGPQFTGQVCSPLQVSWSVRPQCAKLDINSLSQWCKNNVFAETSAQGIRKLVTNPALLSEIKN